MTPTERIHLKEQTERIRRQEQRDPVDNAVWAFCALSDAGKLQMIRKFNQMQTQNGRKGLTLTLEVPTTNPEVVK